MVDSNDKIARLAKQAIAQCWRNPTVKQRCTLMKSIVRLLAKGGPISLDELAEVAGWPVARVAHVLDNSLDAEWTETGLLIGLCVTNRPTPHRLAVDGRTLFVWCAFHALTVPVILGRKAHLESACAVTGTRIEVEISATGVALADPATAVIAISTDIGHAPTGITPPCVHQALFREAAVTARWVGDHPGHHILSVHDAGRYTRLVTEC